MRKLTATLLFVFLMWFSLALTGCSGGGSWRYDPGIPSQVSTVNAMAGYRLVTLSWSASSVAQSYNVYYIAADDPAGLSKSTGTKIAVNATSCIVNGLTNNKTYLFMVTALNRDGESVESVHASATPGSFSVASFMGPSAFSSSDIPAATAFAAKLQNDPDAAASPVSQWIWQQFDASTRQTLTNPGATATQIQAALTAAFNTLIQGGTLIYDQGRFAGVTLRQVTLTQLAAYQNDPLTGENLVHLNRLLLEDVYPAQLLKQTGTWYYHTLVAGPDARWEYGTLTIDDGGVTVISGYHSSDNAQTPAGFTMQVEGNGDVTLTGTSAWPGFHGALGSAKSMLIASHTPTLQSRALTVMQKKKDASAPDYTIADIMGAGSGQSAIDPTLQGNGPTRFTYHQIYSGASNEWEYSNAKVGQHGNRWLEQYKDITYWDYASPSFHTRPGYDIFWKVSSFGIDQDGLVSEYWNYEQTGVFNILTIHSAHEAVFSGQMTADKTIVVGVGTRSDMDGANPRYFMRIMELNFKPVDQTLPVYNLNSLAGTYKFHKLGSAGSSSYGAYGSMTITTTGAVSFPANLDLATGTSVSATPFTLAYFPDPGSDGKQYSDYANFTTTAQDGTSHYYTNGNTASPLHVYYDFWSYPSVITNPSTWAAIPISSSYYNEHGSLSYNKDMFVLTRSETAGNCLLIGLK